MVDDNYNTAYSMISYFVKNKSTTALKNIIRLTAQGYETEKAIAITYGSFNAFETSYKQFYNLHR